MVPGLNFSQKKSGVHPVKFFEKDSRAYLTGADLTGELICLYPFALSEALLKCSGPWYSKIDLKYLNIKEIA